MFTKENIEIITFRMFFGFDDHFKIKTANVRLYFFSFYSIQTLTATRQIKYVSEENIRTCKVVRCVRNTLLCKSIK